MSDSKMTQHSRVLGSSPTSSFEDFPLRENPQNVQVCTLALLAG